MLPWWRLLVAVILLPLASTESPPPPLQISLERSRRSSGDAYIIADSCETDPVNAAADPPLMGEMHSAVNSKCHVIIHMRKRGLSNLFVEIDIGVNSVAGSPNLAKENPIEIAQGSFKLECKPDPKRVECSDRELLIVNETLYFQEDRIYCSFIMKSKKKLRSHFESNAQKPILSYDTKDAADTIKSERLEFGEDRDRMWELARDRCDPDLASTVPKEDTSIPGLTIAPVVDITKPHLTCPPGRQLHVESGGNLMAVDSVVCAATWKKKDVGKSDETDLENAFVATCRTKHCTKCVKLPLFDCPTCSKSIFTQEGDECATITCDKNDQEKNGKWILNGNWTLNPIFECRKEGSGHKWFNNVTNTVVEKGSCTSEFDCFANQKPSKHCDPTADKCVLPTFSDHNKNITCHNGSLIGFGAGQALVMASYSCDVTTGIYTSQERDKLPNDAKLGCYELKVTAAKKTEPPSTTAPMAVTGVLLLILIVVAVALFFVLKRRRDKEWTKYEDEKEEEDKKHSEAERKKKKDAQKIEDERKAGAGSALKQRNAPLMSTYNKTKQVVEKKKKEAKTGSQSSGSRESKKSGKSNPSKKSSKEKFAFREMSATLKAPKREIFIRSEGAKVPLPRNTPDKPAPSVCMNIGNKRLADLRGGASTTKGTVTKATTTVSADGGKPIPTSAPR